MFWTVFLIGMTLFLAFAFYMQSLNKKQETKFEEELNKKGLYVGTVKDKLNAGVDNSFIALDSKKEYLLFMKIGVRPELKIIPLSDIKAVELETDGESIYKKTVGSTVTRAVIGGVLLGGLGAVVGAITGSLQKISTLKRVSIVTSGNSGANCYMHIIDNATPQSLKKQKLMLAEKWVRIIEGNLK